MRVLIVSILLAIMHCASDNSRLNRAVGKRNSYVVGPVQVLPMHKPGIEANRYVVIRDGVIVQIAASLAGIDPTIDRLDGKGMYLMPALVDMHTHLNDENDLILYLANGVTLVRAMGDSTWWARLIGFAGAKNLRERVRSGGLVGPRILTTGLILEGHPLTSPMMKKVQTAEEGRLAVRALKNQGYDFVKVYDNLNPETFTAILNESKALSMQVTGHLPKAVSPEEGLKSGISSFEHLTEYFDNDLVNLRFPETDRKRLIRLARETGTYNVPTLVIFDKLVPPAREAEITNMAEMKYMTWKTHFWWGKTLEAVYANQKYSGPVDQYANACLETMATLTRDLHTAGAPIMVGTDGNFVGVFPGFSVHREMELLVKRAGLSPYAALRAATLTPYEFLREDSVRGSIQVGRRADMVLLKENPMQEISHTRSIAGVFLDGRYFSRAELDAALKTLE